MESQTEMVDEMDALRLENRQLKRSLAELNLKFEALLLDTEQKQLVNKYQLREGDGIDFATRAIRRANGGAVVSP